MRRIDSSFVLVLLASSIILTLFVLFLSTRLYIPEKSESQNYSTLRQTTNGPVEGIVLTTSLGQMYYAFRGIPFAEPPITGLNPYTGEYIDQRFKV